MNAELFLQKTISEISRNTQARTLLVVSMVAMLTYVATSLLPPIQSEASREAETALKTAFIGYKSEDEMPQPTLKNAFNPIPAQIIDERAQEIERASIVEADPNFKIELLEPEAITSNEPPPSVEDPGYTREIKSSPHKALN